jgi:tetratricopeptide (TPR) repeat protein
MTKNRMIFKRSTLQNYLQQVHQAYQQQLFKKAVKLLRHIIKDNKTGKYDLNNQSGVLYFEASCFLCRILLVTNNLIWAQRELQKLTRNKLFEQGVQYKTGLRSQIYTTLGLNCALLGRWSSAVRALQQGIKADNKLPIETLNNMALVALEMNNFRKAEQILKKALRVIHSERNDSYAASETCFQLANLYYIQGSFRPAIKIINQGLEYANNLYLLALLADIQRSQQLPIAAQKVYQRIIKISPVGKNTDYARFKLGDLYYETGQFKAAVTVYRQLIKHHPKSPLRVYARIFLRHIAKKGKYNSDKSFRYIIPGFHAVVQKPALNNQGFCGPATILNLLYDWYQRAGLAMPSVLTQEFIARKILKPTGGTEYYQIKEFIQSLGIEAYSFVGNTQLVKELVQHDIPVLVDEYYGFQGHALAVIGYDDIKKVLICRDPNYAEPVEILVSEFRRHWLFNGNRALILASRSELLDKIKDNTRNQLFCSRAIVNHYDQANKLFYQGRYQAALRSYGQIKKQAPWYLAARRRWIEGCLIKNDINGASRELKKLINSGAHQFWVWKYWGDVQLIKGYSRNARLAYQKANHIYSHESIIYGLIGETYLKENNYDKARVYFRYALNIEPRAAWLYKRVGMIYEQKGQLSKANKLYQIASELISKETKLKEYLQVINKLFTV